MSPARPDPIEECPACGGPLPAKPALRGRDLAHGTPGEHSVLVCPRCGAGVTAPEVPEAELAGLYPERYGPHASDGPLGGAIGRLLMRREARIGAAGALPGPAPGDRLLDVGCGDGELGASLASRGWRVDGIDPSPEACERARAAGIAARPGTLATVELEPAAYRAVLFSHSLEHTADPVGALSAARAALAPGGVAAVSAPNFGSWASRRFGPDWYHLDLPRHRVHFTQTALRMAFERAGLRPERTWTTTSPTGLAASAQYRRMGGLAGREGDSRRAAGQLAGVALIPIARAEQALGGGRDTLHALAVAAA